MRSPKRRQRGPDGSFEPLICRCDDCGRVYEYDARRGHTRRRCNSCRANGWRARPDRVELKKQLIALRGGSCHICGYHRHHGALTFHHLDPLTKEMHIAGNHTRRWDVLEHEVRKCALLCMNCHRELHDGAAALPSDVVLEISEYIRDLPRDRIFKPQGRPRSRPDGL